MLKQGLFIDESGTEYTVYEQSVDGFSRMDFCEKDANFHTDVGAVKFSIVKQKIHSYMAIEISIGATMGS